MNRSTPNEISPAWSVENEDGHSVSLLPCECCEALTLAIEIDAATVSIRIDDIKLMEELRDSLSAAVEYQKYRPTEADAEDDYEDRSGRFRGRRWHGHAPSSIRELFLEWLDLWSVEDAKTPVEGFEVGRDELLPALSACTDILPCKYCDRLNLRHGSTYADAVEEMYSKMA